MLGTTAKMLWRTPGKFGIASLLGRSYSLRCVVFHEISAAHTPFTRGISVHTTPEEFEAKLQFLVAHYTPVRLGDVLAARDGGSLPPRPILVTFDDAYASVVDVAAPLCAHYGVPAVFFVNAAFLDNQRMAPDNLVCYVASEFGMTTIAAGVRAVLGPEFRPPASLAEIFGEFFPSISLDERAAFLRALTEIAGIDERTLAAKAGMYLTSKQIRDLARFNFEVGNHTFNHVHCRTLTADGMIHEIDRNKQGLEAITGMPVRSFSVPYGSAKDLTADVVEHLRQTGHEAAFLSESVANSRRADYFHLDRVSTHTDTDASFFMELEVLPRLRAIRNDYFRPAHVPADDKNSTGRSENGLQTAIR
jgi:peptidoglycan/xylan/chitin deacetylase (PgdA/CDA1 family)